MESNRWSFAELKAKISLAVQWIIRKIRNAWKQAKQKIRNIWNWIKAKPVLAALLFFFVIPSYWARENIAAAIQQANIDFTGAIWFGGLLLCAWLILLRTAKQPRPVQVMTAGAVSLLIFFCIAESIRFLIRHQALSAKIWETGTFWTLAALLISSPVAFVVWRFRDENQSNDINLKEFQKISEWVTGAHFQEEKHSEKFSGSLPENADAAQPSERSREYYRPAASAQALHTFSKQDGAVGLQIAAVYNLLPFYRGDYGQAFEKPSVHLLHSAWQVLQHDILQELDKTDDKGTRDALIQKLHQRADSPLGQAITRVLLACDHNKKPLLHRHLEILPGICLSGMDFNLAGLESKILRDKLFCKRDLSRAQWQGVRGVWEWDLSEANLYNANLSGAQLYGANMFYAELGRANLSGTQLGSANLSHAGLGEANLSGTEFCWANLSNTWFYGANLAGAEFRGAKMLNVKKLTAEQLSAAETLKYSLTDTDSFFQHTKHEQQQLQAKGLIVLYYGSCIIAKYLFCQHQIEDMRVIYPANSIPFPIDLAATQAANPDWKISIDKDDEEQ